MELSEEYVNPNDYLNKLMIDKQELTEEQIQEGVNVSAYAKSLIDVIPYVEGGTDIQILIVIIKLRKKY